MDQKYDKSLVDKKNNHGNYFTKSDINNWIDDL